MLVPDSPATSAEVGAERWAWLLPVLVVPAVLAAPFAAGKLLLFRDLLHDCAPQLPFAAQAALQGRIPEWNPYLFSGVPFVAPPGNHFYYPVSVLLGAVLPPFTAATALILVHLPLAAGGVYGLARELGVGRVMASVASLGFVASGYLLGMHGTDIYFVSTAWLPGAVWMMLGTVRRAGTRGVALAALPIALLTLWGELQMDMLVGLLGLGLAVASPSRVQATSRVLAALGLGAAVGAVQLVPAALFAAGSVRAHGMTFAELVPWSLSPVRLIELVLALPFGVPFPENSEWMSYFESSPNEHAWAISLYLTPVLSIAALATRWRTLSPEWRVLAGATGLALLLAMGSHTPLLQLWVTVVPLANRFRYPEKFLSVFTLGMVLLGARAHDAAETRAPTRSLIVVLVVGALVAVTALAVAAIDPAWLDAAIGSGLHLSGGTVSLDAARDTLSTSASEALAALVGMALVLFLRHQVDAGRPELRGRADALLVALVLATTLPVGLRTLSYGRAPFFDRPPPLSAELKSAAAPGSTGRVFAARTCPFRRLDLPEATPFEEDRAYGWLAGAVNYPQLWGVPTVMGYSAAVPSEIAEIKSRVPQFPSERPARLLGAATIRTCDAQGTPRVESLPDALPRVAFLRSVPTPPEQIAAGYTAPDFEPSSDALVAEGEAAALPRPEHGEAKVVVDEPEKVEVSVSGEGGLLVLADRFDRGWSVAIDGQPAPLIRANLLWRGVVVGAGAHHLEYRYRTPGIGWGEVISLLGLLLGALMLVRPAPAVLASPVEFGDPRGPSVGV